MPFENHFHERKLPENASREEKASVKAAIILMRIIENYFDDHLRSTDAIVHVQGSCVEDLFLRVHGLTDEQQSELKFQTGLTPMPIMSAERTA